MGHFKEKFKSLAIYIFGASLFVGMVWVYNADNLFDWVPAPLRDGYNAFAKFAILYNWYLMIGAAVLLAVIFLGGTILEAIKTIFRK